MDILISVLDGNYAMGFVQKVARTPKDKAVTVSKQDFVGLGIVWSGTEHKRMVVNLAGVFSSRICNVRLSAYYIQDFIVVSLVFLTILWIVVGYVIILTDWSIIVEREGRIYPKIFAVVNEIGKIYWGSIAITIIIVLGESFVFLIIIVDYERDEIATGIIANGDISMVMGVIVISMGNVITQARSMNRVSIGTNIVRSICS